MKRKRWMLWGYKRFYLPDWVYGKIEIEQDQQQ